MKFKIGDEVIITNIKTVEYQSATGAIGIITMIKRGPTGVVIQCENWSKPHPEMATFTYSVYENCCELSAQQKNVNKLKKVLGIG